MAGKTVLGRRPASHWYWPLISGDDLALAARGVTQPASHPAGHSMSGIDQREYYTRYSVDELLEMARREHAALWGEWAT